MRLANTSFALTSSSTNREYCLVQDSLLATLETELISNEKTLVRQPVPTSADWIINVRITGFSNPQPLVQQVGTGGSSGSLLRWSGSLGLAYQVADRSGRAHDAGNVRYVYDKQFECYSGPVPVDITSASCRRMRPSRTIGAMMGSTARIFASVSTAMMVTGLSSDMPNKPLR